MRWVRPAYALALAVLVGAPLFGPGYLLLRDAVSTPRSYLSDAALGLTAAPRATPQDFAVALGSSLLDGGVLVKGLLLGGLWLAGWGAARLVADVLPDAGLGGQCVAATLAIWNPYVAERLLQGHWSLLLGYGCLPWVAVSMLGLRADEGPRTTTVLKVLTLGFWIALAGLTPTGLMLAATIALVCAAGTARDRPAARTRRWCVAVAVGLSLLSALPWLVAGVLGSGLEAHSVPGQWGVRVFAARAEPGLGTLASVAGLGGIWNGQAVPASRTTAFAAVATAVLLAVVAAGLPVVLRRSAARGLLALSAVSVLAPALAATAPGLRLLGWAVDLGPGLGLLRDGQKWVALAVPGYALAGAAAVITLRRWLPGVVAAALCCLALVAVLPDLAGGVGGRVHSVRYPAGWYQVAARINAEPATVAVLPASTMRRFTWSGKAVVLDPLPRWIGSEVLQTGDLVISGLTVPGEGTRARAIQELLLAGASPTDLARAGVGWLVVEADSAGVMGAAARTLAALHPVYRDADISLYRIGGTSPGVSADRRLSSILAHLPWLALLLTGGLGLVAARVRRWRAVDAAGGV